MLIARPTTLAAIFDALTGLPLNRIRHGRTTSLCPLNQPLRPAE